MIVDKLTRIQLEEAADFLAQQFPFINTVDLVIQLGSGQDAEGLLDDVWNRLPLQRMPHLPKAESLARHRLEVLWGKVGRFNVLIYSGRYHFYEGFGRTPVLLPIWAAATIGARNFLFCNASGGVHPDAQPGTLVVVNDHINNLGVSPLLGHQHLLRSSYVDMSNTYSRKLSETLLAAARAEQMPVCEGVYMANQGPQFETPAEIRLAQLVGADIVGMSTVLEAIAAHAFGARVAAVSLVSNRAAGLGEGRITHEENLRVGQKSHAALTATLRRWIGETAADII